MSFLPTAFLTFYTAVPHHPREREREREICAREVQESCGKECHGLEERVQATHPHTALSISSLSMPIDPSLYI
jgi:hypothetical protein